MPQIGQTERVRSAEKAEGSFRSDEFARNRFPECWRTVKPRMPMVAEPR